MLKIDTNKLDGFEKSDGAYRYLLDVNKSSYVFDHKVGGDLCVIPATIYLRLAVEVGRDVIGRACLVKNLTIHRVLVPELGSLYHFDIRRRQSDNMETIYDITNIIDGVESSNAHDLLASFSLEVNKQRIDDSEDFSEIKSRFINFETGESFYSALADEGYRFGSQHRSLSSISIGEDEALGVVENHFISNIDSENWHPAFVDGFSHVALSLLPESAGGVVFVTAVQQSILIIGPLPGRVKVHARLLEKSANSCSFDITIFSEENHILARFSQYRLISIDKNIWVDRVLLRESIGAYKKCWHEKQVDGVNIIPSGKWIIFHSQENAPIAHVLQKGIGETITVVLGNHFEVLCEDAYVIDSKSSESFTRLISSVQDSLKQPIEGICYLLNLDDDGFQWSPLQRTKLEFSFVDPILPVLYLTQALSINGVQTLKKFAFVAHSETMTDQHENDAFVLSQAIVGLGCVIKKEYPELRWQHIAASSDENSTYALLLSELLTSSDETEVFLNGEQRYVARLDSLNLDKKNSCIVDSNPCAIRSDGGYLITGGSGEIGRELVKWLVEKGAGEIYVLGRSSINSAMASSLLSLSESENVFYFQTDVSNLDELSQTLEILQKRPFQLRGVFHLAGVTHDALLFNQTAATFRKVFSVKAQGAFNLHSFAPLSDLDFTIYFSSVTAWIGQIGIGNYAAANAFLDALATRRTAMGMPTYCVQWGPWKTGMYSALDQIEKNNWLQQGFAPFSPQEGLRFLEKLLRYPPESVGYFPINWQTASTAFSHGRTPSILAFFAKDDVNKNSENSALLAQLESSPIDERKDILALYIYNLIGAITDTRFSQQRDKKSFREFGITSIGALELKVMLEKDLGMSLAPTLLFNYTTVDSLVDYLLDLKQLSGHELKKNVTRSIKNSNIDAAISNDILAMDDDALMLLLNDQIDEINTLLEE